jgi:hypothetical protein
VQTASITDSQLRSSLLDRLNTALQFQQRQTGAGNTAVSACIVFDKASVIYRSLR